ncbi:MAG: hypothetical protein KY475_12930 [Planctomycetes bacterium]|nr:hypothetical protein [Planctomycetota bacterium]
MKTKAGLTWKVWAIVGGVVLAALGLLGALLGAGLTWGWPSPLSREDRDVLVVAAELAPLLPEFVLRSDAESFSKRQFFDGRVQLAYHYINPDAATPLRLTSRVTVAANRAEARSLYEMEAAALGTTAQRAGYELDQRGGFFAWGDASRYGLLRDGAEAAGYVLACRRGEKVIVVELSGINLDEGLFGELVLPSLQSLESYEP